MDSQELVGIIQETLQDTVSSLTTLAGNPVTSSKDVFNATLLSYEGGLTLASGQRLLWALNRDDEGWELSTLEM